MSRKAPFLALSLETYDLSAFLPFDLEALSSEGFAVREGVQYHPGIDHSYPDQSGRSGGDGIVKVEHVKSSCKKDHITDYGAFGMRKASSQCQKVAG